LRQKPGKPANVVFVAVRDADASYAVFFALKVADVGEDKVNAQHFFFGEAHAEVHQYNVFAIFNDGHVLTHLSEAADRYKSYVIQCGFGFYIIRLLHFSLKTANYWL
jgi:hypothetical protein